MAAALPRPFRPQLFDGWAIGGICLIRLKRVRPAFLPISWGIGSENAAHRIAVEWSENGETKHGVYIPRRDTNSRLNSWAGGTIFPGRHHHASFNVIENGEHYSVTMTSGDAKVHVSGTVAATLPNSSVFGSVSNASDFFEQGSLGYSDTKTQGKYDGLELDCSNWHVESLNVDSIQSSYFEDTNRFPAGSVEFDCALLMRNIVTSGMAGRIFAVPQKSGHNKSMHTRRRRLTHSAKALWNAFISDCKWGWLKIV